jgi:hypothetical protein
MLLFPGCLGHRTQPFGADRHRISVAFDARAGMQLANWELSRRRRLVDACGRPLGLADGHFFERSHAPTRRGRLWRLLTSRAKWMSDSPGTQMTRPGNRRAKQTASRFLARMVLLERAVTRTHRRRSCETHYGVAHALGQRRLVP